jgi:predicted amidohydrolase YtcJ
MLIRQAELDGILLDVRVGAGRIEAIAPALRQLPGDIVLEARGGALLPGLHDHHAHLFATAAALVSVHCGPPDILDRRSLAASLHKMQGDGWLRGIGYVDCWNKNLSGDVIFCCMVCRS